MEIETVKGLLSLPFSKFTLKPTTKDTDSAEDPDTVFRLGGMHTEIRTRRSVLGPPQLPETAYPVAVFLETTDGSSG